MIIPTKCLYKSNHNSMEAHFEENYFDFIFVNSGYPGSQSLIELDCEAETI